MKYALNVPLLAFLNMKKREYLDNPELDYGLDYSDGRRRTISDWIESLMNYTNVKVVGQGAARWGQSYAGREHLFYYAGGEMILFKARQQNLDKASPGIQDSVRDFASLHLMSPEQLWSGTEFPTGGYAVGTEKESPLGLGGPASTEWGKTLGDPKGSKGRSITPAQPYAPNEIINAMVTNELLPMILQNPAIREKLQATPPALLAPGRSSSADYLTDVKHYAKRLIGVINESQDKLKLKSQPGEPVSLMALFEPENIDLLSENVFQLQRLLVGVPPDDIVKMLYVTASSIDRASTLSPEDLENLHANQLFPYDEAAYQEPQFSEARMVADPTTGQVINPEALSPMERISHLEGEISTIYGYMVNNDFLPPAGENSTEELKRKLIESGTLSAEQAESNVDAINIAIDRINLMKDKTREMAERLRDGTLSEDATGTFQLSKVISNELVTKLIQALTTRGKQGQDLPILSMSPAMRHLLYSTSGYALVSDYQLCRDLLLSISGLFGLSNDYNLSEAYKALGITGAPIVETPATLDNVLVRNKRGIGTGEKKTFIDEWRERNRDEAFQHPRFVEMEAGVDPETGKPIGTNIKLLADQFTPEALAKKYGRLFANVPEFQGVSPEQIINELKEEILRFVQRYYIGPDSELAQRSPDAAARAASAFFIPTDLLDESMDIVSESIIQTGEMAFFVDPYEVAGETLFMIKDMVDKRDDPNNIISSVQEKYPGMRAPLLMKIIEDISQGKGSATRAIQALGNVNNVRKLRHRTAKRLKAFTKTAMRRMERQLEV
jgi:hypothetical protein